MGSKSPPTPPPRALVVDDDQDIRDVLELLLITLGYEVRLAGDGAEALAALTDFSPRVVLMDLNMPVMDGFEAARRIRATPDGAAVELIAYTAQSGERIQQRIREAGFNRFLTKPADLEHMIEALAHARSD